MRVERYDVDTQNATVPSSGRRFIGEMIPDLPTRVNTSRRHPAWTIESAIASAEEVANALRNQPQGADGQSAEGQLHQPPTLDTVRARKEKIKALMALVAQLTPDQREQFKLRYPEGAKKLLDTGLNRLEQELKEAIAQQLPKAA